MKIHSLPALLLLALLVGLSGCTALITDVETGTPDPQTQPVVVEEPAATVAITAPTITTTAIATAEVTTTVDATATASPTAAPGSTPADPPAGQVEPHRLARQIVEQAALTAPAGWQVVPCEGEAPFLCVSEGQTLVGTAELLIYPLSGYAGDHPVRLAANMLPAAGAEYTDAEQAAAREALTVLAEEHLEVIAEDRAITYPGDTFTPLDVEPVQMGALPALAFGFVHTDPTGEVVERYLHVAAFDQNFIYWFGINYDPANITTFVSDAALTDFEASFREIAAGLPVP